MWSLFAADMVGRVNVGGRCFTAYRTASTYADAKQVCAVNGLQLLGYSWATQEQQTAVNNAVLGMYAQEQTLWLGATDLATEGTFVWEDGAPVTTTRWNANQPDNYGNEDCLQLLNGVVRGLWNDAPCTSKLRFVCMEPTTCNETGRAVCGRQACTVAGHLLPGQGAASRTAESSCMHFVCFGSFSFVLASCACSHAQGAAAL